jgi:hypothetical protein
MSGPLALKPTPRNFVAPPVLVISTVTEDPTTVVVKDTAAAKIESLTKQVWTIHTTELGRCGLGHRSGAEGERKSAKKRHGFRFFFRGQAKKVSAKRHTYPPAARSFFTVSSEKNRPNNSNKTKKTMVRACYSLLRPNRL